MAYGQSSTLVVKKNYPRKMETNQALGKMKIKSYDFIFYRKKRSYRVYLKTR